MRNSYPQLQILQAFFPIWNVLILHIIKRFLSVPGMEIRAQKQEVSLGKLGRWGRRSLLSGSDGQLW